MNVKYLALMGFCGLALAPLCFSSPASACTPAPDNPNGCDGINGGIIRRIPREPQVKIPYPGPTCLSCPSLYDRLDPEVQVNPQVIEQLQPQVIQQPQLLNMRTGY